MTTFIYEYPDGKEPTYWVFENWIVTYPEGDKHYFMRDELWHPYPEGGKAEMRVHQGFVYDFPDGTEPRYYLREVDQ
jgi:hypothetical protein